MTKPSNTNTDAKLGSGNVAPSRAVSGSLAHSSRTHAVPTNAAREALTRAITKAIANGAPVYVEWPVGCDHFQSDGRGCCRHCGHFHGRMEG